VTGTIDPATIAAIRATQQRFKLRDPNTVVDGRVSPARNGYSFGGSQWAIIRYNNILQEHHRDVWPRIDRITGCPPALQAAVVRTLVGD
jgi:hypothetical protein